jgi:hypothetical protein
VHAMKAYRKLEIQLHSFVTSPLDRVEVCGWRLGRFIRGDIARSTRLNIIIFSDIFC